MNICRLLLITVLFLMGGFVFAGTIDPRNSDEQYIEFAQQELFDCVAPLFSKKNNKITSLSSCVVIKPRFALTAAHIFSTIGTDQDYYIEINGESVLVEKVISHKVFNHMKMGFNDIAICKMSKSVDIEKFPVLYSKRNELHKKAYICGYGITGTFDSGGNISDGKKRAGTNIIEAINDHTLICSPSLSKNSNLEFLICHGDSGGGLFIDNQLAGINSYVYTRDGKADSSRRDIAGHTRIVLFRKWIEENTQDTD